jgi:uncharacterized damage-inducible protein DinB
MTPAERERAVSYLTRTRDDLLRATRPLSRDQLRFKPAPGRWSVAECLEHLVAVENRVLEGVFDALQKPGDPSKRSAFDGRDDAFMQIVTDRSQQRQAPDPVVPSTRWPVDQLIPEFEAARKRSTDLAATTNANLRLHFLPHRTLGELDCYQWLLMIAGHSDRHRAQIAEVLAAPDFPQTTAV